MELATKIKNFIMPPPTKRAQMLADVIEENYPGKITKVRGDKIYFATPKEAVRHIVKKETIWMLEDHPELISSGVWSKDKYILCRGED